MMDVNVVICGSRGNMGKVLTEQCLGHDEMHIVGAVERPSHPDIGMDIGNGFSVVDDLDKCLCQVSTDVIVDFTSPAATLEHLEAAIGWGDAMVIGTTGFSSEQIAVIKKGAEKIPIVLASNFSIGANLLFKLLSQAASILGDDYDVEIVEAHHNRKNDAPSGTAKTMAEVIAKALGRDLSICGVYSRLGVGKRKPDEIGIQSVRGGNIFGDHTVMFCGASERLEFIHRAGSLDSFAQGAIKAAKWVVGMGRKSGLYNMQDVLGLR